MVFSSGVFLFLFLPIVLAIYYICPGKLRNTVLFVFSLIFYARGEPIYVGIMIFSTAFDYCNGMLIETFRKKHNEKICKIVMIMSVFVNLGILAFFKYTDFVITNINNLFGASVSLLQIALPIGISFYTFQTLSYTIDVYLGKVKVQHNIINFGMYVSMFPQLIAGPIVRYSDVENQIARRNENIDDIANGFRRFIVGLSKKILVANQVGNLWDEISAMSSITTSMAWVGAIAYTFQIYFDFSGYSDMAIGLGQMFGFKFPENFNYPYESKSITEFWRRWHMTLGTWFREYLYIPLGGNKKGVPRQIFNLFIVWFLTGLWHGAGWNFVCWGLYFFIILVLEKFVLKKVLNKCPNILKHIYSLILIVCGWVIFACTDMSEMGTFFKAMFGIKTPFLGEMSLYYIGSYAVILIIAAIASTKLPKYIVGQVAIKMNVSNNVKLIVSNVACLILFFICVAFLVGDSYNPFLYFRF